MVMGKRVDYEERFEMALRRILRYMTPAQLRRHCERQYGLSYEESLEMAYENVLGEARSAIAGYRRRPRESPLSADAVDPHAGTTTGSPRA
jgi:hypothetical protein